MFTHKNRYDIHKEIESLDPQRDNQRIVYLVGSYEYPWLIQKSLEFALFRTYAVPETSEILAQTGEFTKHGQRRYDDTTLMLAGIAEHGYDSEYGRAAIRQMNRLHGRYGIENEDFLYVLSTFIFEPIRWHKEYGWRRPSRNEELANYYFWYEIGRRMNIKNIPTTYEEFEAFNIAHERTRFRYDEANRKIGEATMRIFLDWYPAPLRPLIREGLLAFMDDPLLNAMGFSKPHGIVRWVAHTGLKLMGRIMRYLPPRSKPFIFTELPNRSYPQGFQIDKIGAPEALKAALKEEAQKAAKPGPDPEGA